MIQNQRVMITKLLLKNALISLLKQKSIQTISIIELCKEAQVNRSTFYKHYDSQYELLDEIEIDMFSKAEEWLSKFHLDESQKYDSIISILTYIESNLEFCNLLFHNNADPEFSQKIVKLAMPFMIEKSNTSKKNDELVKFLNMYIFEGSFHLIKEWVNDTNIISKAKLAKILEDNADTIYKRYSLI